VDHNCKYQQKKHTGKENIFPDSSGNYNTEIKKGMKILQRNWRGIKNTISGTKFWKMLKIKENYNKEF
jgi:hypothetical protein